MIRRTLYMENHIDKLEVPVRLCGYHWERRWSSTMDSSKRPQEVADF